MKLSIRLKIFAGIGIVILLMIVNSIVGYRMMGSISHAKNNIISNNKMEQFLAHREADHLAWVNQLSDVFRTAERFTGQLDHTQCELGTWYYSFLQSDDYNVLPSYTRDILRQMDEPHRLLHQTAAQINEAMTGNADLAGAQVVYTNDTLRHLKEVRGLIEEAQESLAQESERLLAQAAQSELSANRILLLTTLAAFLAGALVVFLLGRAITNPINLVVDMLKDMAQSGGNLTKRIEVSAKDEVGELAHWFNTFVVQLQEMVNKIKSSVNMIASSSQELSAAVEESNASMEEITSVVESEVAQKASDISIKSHETLDAAKATQLASQEGDQAVQEVVKVMNVIDESTMEASHVIGQLEKASREIGMIIETITAIAEQTNLLALNAAIEAARAGESGRGFAVVAEEVRKLAENSNQAGIAIVKLINDIQVKVQDAVKTMDSNKEMVRKGKEVAQKTREILAQVHEIAIREVTLVNEVYTAAETQASSAQEIAASTEEQVGVISQISGTASQMADMAEQLNVLVAGFIS